MANSIELRIDPQKSSIADGIWGSNLNKSGEQGRTNFLSSFLVYYENQREFEQIPSEDIASAIRLLKGFPEKRKCELRGGRSETPTATSERLRASILDLAVRCIFLTACSPPGTISIGGGSIFRPRWKDNESLEEYLKRVFPISRSPQQDLAVFRLGKLCASYLHVYSSVQVEWTDFLSDHLILLRGEGWKKLYIFRHPGFLKVSLDTLRSDDEDMTHTNLGALHLYAISFPQFALCIP